jgi:hypothetical protein
VDLVRAEAAAHRAGASPQQAYRAAFLGEDGWSEAFLASIASSAVVREQARQALDLSRRCLVAATHQVRSVRDTSRLADDEVSHLEILDADLHAGRPHPLLIWLDDGRRVVHKTGSGAYHSVIAGFERHLEQDMTAPIRVPNHESHAAFHLAEFIEQTAPRPDEAVGFFRQFGRLVCFLDAMNFCDGHAENVVLTRDGPVVVDVETVLHHFDLSDGGDEERSILFTGLVQKPPTDEIDEGIHAPLQLPSSVVELLTTPYAQDDRTSDIVVRYRGLTRRDAGVPDLGLVVADHVGDVIDGYRETHQALMRHKHDLLGDNALWSRASECVVRHILRTTLYYSMLVRQWQRPEWYAAADRASAARRLLESLDASKRTSAFEAVEIRLGRIPLFEHRAGEPHLYARGRRYEHLLAGNGVEDVRSRLGRLDDAYAERQVEILENNLAADVSVAVLPYSTASDHPRPTRARSVP